MSARTIAVASQMTHGARARKVTVNANQAALVRIPDQCAQSGHDKHDARHTAARIRRPATTSAVRTTILAARIMASVAPLWSAERFIRRESGQKVGHAHLPCTDLVRVAGNLDAGGSIWSGAFRVKVGVNREGERVDAWPPKGG
jgi:hypothetical protein